ncbi:MAG: rhomboid family intramembrane serine protease [Actinomycetota bacterium]|nr:rhomboid family intramembrane serine protease [Actinomycetota bacterium]
MSTPAAPSGPSPQTDAPTCYRHPNRETWVRCTRCDRPICPDCMQEASVGFQCPECVAAGRRSTRPVRTAFGGAVSSSGAVVTKALIGLNVLVFLATAANGLSIFGDNGSPIYRRFALVPLAVADGQWYRLVTAAFLHYGLLHIAFNMYVLLMLGAQLERLLGRWRYLALYLVAGVGGNALAYLISPLGTASAGASGAIFGLFAAYFVVARKMRADTGQIVGLIVINLVLTFAIPSISVGGHIGGLVTGGIAGLALAYAPAGSRRTAVQVAGLVGVLLVEVAVVLVRTAALTGS